MLKRPTVIVIAMLVAVAGFVLYVKYRVPPGVAPKSDAAETLAWLGLATSVVSLLTAIVGLMQKLIELGSSKRGG
jgi:hypothetical protein